MTEKVKKPITKSTIIDLDENKICKAKFVYKNGILSIKYRTKLFPPKSKTFVVDEKVEYYLIVDNNIYKMELPLELSTIDYNKLLSANFRINLLSVSSLNMINIMMLIIGILLGLVIGIFISPQIYHPPPQSQTKILLWEFFHHIIS